MDLMEVMSEEKIQTGWAYNPPVIRAVKEIANEMPRGGLKALCVEAALLMFFEAGAAQRSTYIKRLLDAEVDGNVDGVVQSALEVGASRDKDTAAKISKPGVLAMPQRRSAAAKLETPTKIGASKPKGHT